MRQYDELGNTASETYIDDSNLPALRRAGHQRVERTYDGGKRIIQESYWKNDIPFVLADGYASLTRSYDDVDNLLTETYLDENDAPVCCKVKTICKENNRKWE